MIAAAATFKSFYRKHANTPCSWMRLAPSRFRYNTRTSRYQSGQFPPTPFLETLREPAATAVDRPEYLYEALDLVAQGKVKKIIETYPLTEAAKALVYDCFRIAQ
jgi:hypothetical protein